LKRVHRAGGQQWRLICGDDVCAQRSYRRR
jgi:hypothetical protein